MKLIITDNGDPSVGIFQTVWEIPCPFEPNDVDKFDLAEFKRMAKELYAPFCQGKLTACYDYELKATEDNHG